MPIIDYRDPIFMKWYTDSSGTKISILRPNESQKIVKNTLILNEIPDEFHKVQITNYIELPFGSSIVNDNEFVVNYTIGYITFHPSQEGSTINVDSYYARGIVFYPASRIYTSLTESGDIESTFQDMVDSINAYTYQGIYSPTTEYIKNQQVWFEGSTYICKVDTSLGIEPTNETNWRVFAGGIEFIGDFDNVTQYYPRQSVQYEKGVYQCKIKPLVGTLPTDTNYWVSMVSLKDIYDEYLNVLKPDILTATENANNARYIGNYDNETEYKVNNIVRYDNSLYISKQDSLGNLPTNTAYWDISSKPFVWKGTYNGGTEYTPLDVVEYFGSSYISKQDSLGNLPTNTTYWDIIASKGEKGAALVYRGDYNNVLDYYIDELVRYDGNVYVCIQDSTGNLPTDLLYWDIFIEGGGTKVVSYRNTVTINSELSTVPIGISAYSKESDILSVFINSVYIEDYTIDINSENIIKDSGTWESGTIFNFVVLKNVFVNVPEYDGNLIVNNSISNDKLHDSIKIGNINNSTTTNKSDVVAITNEINGKVDANIINIQTNSTNIATNTSQITNISNDLTGVSNNVISINQSIETMYTDATASGSIGLDLSLYTIFDLTLSDAITLDITASADSGDLQSCIVRITQPTSAKAVTFSDTIKWNNDAIADLTTGDKVYVLLFHTIDGGTTFVGQMSSQYTV